MKKEESSIDHFSATQYYQTFSFDYPKTYVISEGGRPFNVNDEGTMYTVNAYCTDAENCRTNNQYCINKTDCIDEKQNTFMVSVYENRQDWNLDEWIRQSVYAPYHECNEKDPKATLQKQTYRNYEAYKFSYASNQNQSHGCINVEGTQKGNGEELFFLNNKVVYSLSTFSNVQKLKLELDRMIETFAIVQN